MKLNTDMATLNELTKDMKKWEPIRSFGLEKQKSESELKEYAHEFNKTNREIISYLNKNQNPIDGDGKSLINYDNQKHWFYDNINFVFSTGCIFDENDNNEMDSVLNSFISRPNYAYLLNSYNVLTYENELVKAIEKKFSIYNGNYHILFAVICSASDEDILNAPLDEFKHRGVITCATTWKSVYDIMKRYITLFGFIAEYNDDFDPKQIGSSRIVRSNMYNVNEGVINLNMPIEKFIDKNEHPEHLEKEHQYKYNKYENMRNGQTVNEDQRVHKNDKLNPRHKQGFSLYDRIENDDITNTVPSTEVGGMLKMNEYYQPLEAKKAEFILFDIDKGTYDVPTGSNVVENMNPSLRGIIPNFSQTTKNNKSCPTKKIIPNSINVFPK